MKKTSPSRFAVLRSLLYVLLAVFVLCIVWVFTHALASDARSANGVSHTLNATVPVVYYVQEPAQKSEKTETVVLLASLGRPVSDFNELTQSLVAAGYRTLAVESRGVTTWSGGGFSSYDLSALAGDVQAAIADAGIPQGTRVHLIGHAYGNRVARTFATLYPQQTAGLVLVAAGDKTSNMPAEVARGLRMSTFGFLPWSMRGSAVSKTFFMPGNVIPEYWQRGWSTWGAIGQVRATKASSNKNFNAGGQGPMLVLQAQSDVVAPPQDAGEMLKASYGARVTLKLVSGAGHAFLPEQGGVIADSIIEFLHEHPAR